MKYHSTTGNGGIDRVWDDVRLQMARFAIYLVGVGFDRCLDSIGCW